MSVLNDDAVKNNLEWLSNLSIDAEPDAVRKSSIICTIGMELVLRVLSTHSNFSHGTYEYHKSVIDNTRKSASSSPGRPVAIALDTKGPEIRTGLMASGADVPFVAGHQMIFTTDEKYAEAGTDKVLYLDYKNITK
ncbi:Pyruvate kinase, partial [Podila horticola]